MKTQSLFLLILISTTALYSCNSSKILTATFESDAINNPPAHNLAGAPSGDMIEYGTALAPQLRVRNSATAGEKALHYTNVPVTVDNPSNRWINFKGISTNLVNTLWFSYTARNSNPTGDMLIDVSDGEGHLIARMRIRANGEVGLARSIADVYTDVIGTLSHGSHTVVFTTTPSALKYNVTIFQTVGSAITATDKPMITTNALQFANPAHPSISFQHASTVEGGSHEYIIEVVTISKKQP